MKRGKQNVAKEWVIGNCETTAQKKQIDVCQQRVGKERRDVRESDMNLETGVNGIIKVPTFTGEKSPLFQYTERAEKLR